MDLQLKLFPSNKVSGDLFFNQYAGTFQLNKERCIHRWYPYIEGYSEQLVTSIVREYGDASSKIYDPFAGAGTTPLTVSHMFLDSYISELNPFMRFVCEVKVNTVRRVAQELKTKSTLIENSIEEFSRLKDSNFNRKQWNDIISDCFPKRMYFDEFTLKKIAELKARILAIREKDKDIGNIFLLALASILVEVSRMKRATDLRYKTTSEIKDSQSQVFRKFREKVRTMYEDIRSLENPHLLGKMVVLSEDAKEIPTLEECIIDLVITSPSYINGTNYFRNTKLELWILDFISKENDLRKFRDRALPSGINDIDKKRNTFKKFAAVEDIACKLDLSAYDKRIPVMVRSYFSDLYFCLLNIYRLMRPGTYAFIDIGDSIFSGTHVPTDELTKNIATEEVGFEFKRSMVLRKRRSYAGLPLSESLIILQKPRVRHENVEVQKINGLREAIKMFEAVMPHKDEPYCRRNWGHRLHSLCSYQSKLKPAIAHFLIKFFTEKGQRVLDPFGGVGTIAFEACLQGRVGISNDINKVAFYNALAKVQNVDIDRVWDEVESVEAFIKNNLVGIEEASKITLKINRDIKEYFHLDTFREILTARKYYLKNKPTDSSRALVISSLLHILHGNRPYALSRRSHGITPFAPSGPYEYKSVIEKLREKIDRVTELKYPKNYLNGESYNTSVFRIEPCIRQVDAIITSPPFYGSTRFHTNNWLRLWFCGWEEEDFRIRKNEFLEVIQSKGISIYEKVFEAFYEVLKPRGICVLHLGVSSEFDMAKELKNYAAKHFEFLDLIYEHVGECEKHGIRDQGITKRHAFLFLKRRRSKI